jgi:transcriptional/translational regulatory protein YebC/TACO1
MFERKGQIVIDAGRFDEVDVLEAALAAGAEDLGTDDGMHVVTTSVQDFHTVQEALAKRSIEIEQAGLAMLPTSTIPVDAGDARRLLRLVESLEDHDDVMKLYSNFEVDDAVYEELASE